MSEDKDHENRKSPNGDILERLIGQDAEGVQQRVELIKGQIEERESLKETVLAALQQQDYLLQDKMGSVFNGPYGKPTDPKKSTMEKQWLDVKKRKLEEEINAWKDISMMHRELQYWEAKLVEYKNKRDLIYDT